MKEYKTVIDRYAVERVEIWRIEIDWIQILIKKYDQIAKRHLSKGWWNEKSHLVVNNSLQLNPNCRHYVITL